MEQHRLQRPLVRFLKHSAPCLRDREVALVFTEQRASLDNRSNKEEGQKVRFVDHFVERKGAGFVEFGPRKEFAHLCNHAARQTPRGRRLQSGTSRRRAEED